MPYSGNQQTQLRPGGFPQAKPGGSFDGKEEAGAEVAVTDQRTNMGAHGILSGRHNKMGRGI